MQEFMDESLKAKIWFLGAFYKKFNKNIINKNEINSYRINSCEINS